MSDSERVDNYLFKILKFFLLGLLLFQGSTSYAEIKTTFYHYDLLGSPVATTDETGAVIWREEYGPWGEKLLKEDEALDNVRGYTGHVNDKETGLTYMQARYYDPQIGRFYGVDPVGFQENNPISFNRYNYANNNPFKFTDPNGKNPFNAGIPRDFFSNVAKDFYNSPILDGVADNTPVIGNLKSAYEVTTGKNVFSGEELPGWVRGVGVVGMVFPFAKNAKRVDSFLTAAQASRVQKVDNIISNHAKPHDFTGVAKELQGIDTGFDHIKEMQQSVTGLNKALRGLRGSLKNPNLSSQARNEMQDSVDKGQSVLGKMTDSLGEEF